MPSGDKKFKLTRAQFLVITGFLLYLLLIFTDTIQLFSEYKWGWWDHLITRYDRRPPNPHVVTFWIGTDEYRAKGPWPWDRRELGKIVETLKSWGAKVILFDIYFRQEKPEQDKKFFEAIRDHGKVILALPWDYSHQNTLERPPENFEKSGAYFGHAATTQKKVYRTCPLFIMNPIYDRTKSLNENINRVSLSLLALMLYNGWEEKELTIDRSLFDERLVIGDLRIPLISSENDLSGIPCNTIVSFSGGAGTFRKKEVSQGWSVLDLFEKEPDEMIKDKVKDSIVVIYNNADPHDAFVTPYSSITSDEGDNSTMPGGEIHAQEICALLDGRIINYNRFTDYSIAFAFLIAGIFLFSAPYSWKIRIAGFFFLCVIWLIFSPFLFQKFRILTSIYMPVILLLLLFIALIFYERKQFITYFGQFVSHRLKDEILRDERRAEVGTREVEATILFADIRGFSTMSEQLTPGELTARMTEYHTAMNRVFDRNRGVILDYLGDAEMVGFGTLAEEKYHVLLAIKAGLEMQDEIRILREKWGIVGGQVIEVGVGICTGTVAEGIVGSDSKKQLISMGDTTNTAARIQALSKQLDSLVTISHSSFEKVEDDIISDPLEEMALKGKTKKVMLYRVKGIKEESLKKLNIKEDR